MRFLDLADASAQRYAVIGLGQFGSALATALAAEGAEVLAIDLRSSPVEAIKEDVDLAVACDATDVEALEAHGVAEMDTVVVAIGSDFEAALLVSVELLELGAPRVITRAYTATQRRILESVGVAEILAPERQMGTHVARQLSRPGLVDYLDLEDDYVVQEVQLPASFRGQTLGDLDLPDRYEVNVITVRRCTDDADAEGPRNRHPLGVPQRTTTLEEGDTLVLFGQRDKIEALMDEA